MKIESLEVGQTVYAISRRKAGNTTLSTVDISELRVEEIDMERRRVRASRHGRDQWYQGRRVTAWRKTRPLTVAMAFGIRRLATRAEIAARKAAQEGE